MRAIRGFLLLCDYFYRHRSTWEKHANSHLYFIDGGADEKVVFKVKTRHLRLNFRAAFSPLGKACPPHYDYADRLLGYSSIMTY
jgi:hypothetical protein